MNIQQAAFVMGDKCRGKNTHKAGQYDQVGFAVINLLAQFGVKGFATAVLFMVDNQRWQTAVAGFLHAGGIRAVADNAGNIGINLAGTDGFGNGQHIAATAGDQNYEARYMTGLGIAQIHTVRVPVNCTCASSFWRAATSPMIQLCSPSAFSNATAASALASGRATIRPTPQLKVRNISAVATLPACCSHSNTAGHFQLLVSIMALQSSGSTRGIFSWKPPPVT